MARAPAPPVGHHRRAAAPHPCAIPPRAPQAWGRGDPVVAEIPAARLDGWFAAEYGTRLEAEGFSPARRRVWIRSEKQPIREGFAVVPLKGYRFVPSWFVSLDFVPHVTDAGQVRWHRTEKSALADLADHAHRPRLELIGVLAW